MVNVMVIEGFMVVNGYNVVNHWDDCPSECQICEGHTPGRKNCRNFGDHPVVPQVSP